MHVWMVGELAASCSSRRPKVRELAPPAWPSDSAQAALIPYEVQGKAVGEVEEEQKGVHDRDEHGSVSGDNDRWFIASCATAT